MGMLKWLFYLFLGIVIAIIVLPVPILHSVKAFISNIVSGIINEISSKLNAASNYKPNPINSTNKFNVTKTTSITPPNLTVPNHTTLTKHKNLIFNIS